MSERAEEHRRLILDEFTRQAAPFAEAPAHSNEGAVRLLIDMARNGLQPWVRPSCPDRAPATTRKTKKARSPCFSWTSDLSY